MKVLLIDDEEKARRLLRHIIEETCKEVKEIYEAPDLEKGVTLIKEQHIDVVFLDVEMPRYSGLEILDFFNEETVTFQVIITTAYEEYAVKAFKLSAVDYLLKPLAVDEVKAAITKAYKQHNAKQVETKIENIKSTLHQMNMNTLALEVPKGIIFVAYDDILYFEADRMYAKVYMKDGQVELISKPLKYFIDQLENNIYFFRPHRSYLINLKHVKGFVKEDGGYLIMKNNKSLPISKGKKDGFLDVIQTVF